MAHEEFGEIEYLRKVQRALDAEIAALTARLEAMTADRDEWRGLAEDDAKDEIDPADMMDTAELIAEIKRRTGGRVTVEV